MFKKSPALLILSLFPVLLFIQACGERGSQVKAPQQGPAVAEIVKPSDKSPVIKTVGDSLTVARIQNLFNEQDYSWPPVESVPRIIIDAFPEGMNSLTVSEKKAMFFRVLLPIVMSENARIKDQRSFLMKTFSDPASVAPGSETVQRLERLMKGYKVEGDWKDVAVQEKLLRRVDTIPAGLVLAQAANESAWGSSRFTREANNIFGQWTYDKDNGLKPANRDDGAKHFIRVFDDLSASVRAYLRNLNMGHAYGELRRLRAAMREDGKALDALVLAGGLLRYSQRGEAYVEEIRAMIRSNKLNRLGKTPLVLSSLQ